MVAVAARVSLVLVLALGPATLSSAAPAAPHRAASVYTGPGFDTCSAPSLTALQSWLASPYRAVGIYIGGANRACPDGNLSTAWAANAVSIGWNLLPLYVGLQAPCVSQPGLALINPSAAASEGAAAADDAVARAGAFGLHAGSPIYFDMEGYKTNSPSCTQAVQAFLTAWSTQLRADGFVAGIYGSAASTIRDLIPLADNGTGPDAAWIADWNGKTSVFGDPYVADTYWPSHQRVHQYSGGHHETYAGVTINIDNDSVDAPVVGTGGVVAPTSPPAPQPQSGSLTTSDGQATVSWPGNAFGGVATVSATPATLAGPFNGFAAGSYVVQLSVRKTNGAAVTRFSAPVTITFHNPPAGLVPAYSPDGTAWRALTLEAGILPTGATAGYALAPDGSLVVSTLAAGSIGLLRDIAPPTTPDALSGRFVRGRLALAWTPATDNSGAIASYEITLNGQPLATAGGTTRSASVRSFYPHRASIFRIVAQDAVGNASEPSGPVVVKPAPRPASLPREIPNWAFQLAAWQGAGKHGKRPRAPRAVPKWYWRWHDWRLHPFRVVGQG